MKKTMIITDEDGRDVEITALQFERHPELRKIIFRLAREEDREAIDFLWENFKLREMTQKEIDQINMNRKEKWNGNTN